MILKRTVGKKAKGAFDCGQGGVARKIILVGLPCGRFSGMEPLVEELVTRLRATDGPRRSYGVVTFSLPQQQLVENLLDEERRKYPEIEIHFGDEPPVEGEPVFVKNLENVQGDERDVIFFSICYGPDEAGKVAMNFGPINRDGGLRLIDSKTSSAAPPRLWRRRGSQGCRR